MRQKIGHSLRLYFNVFASPSKGWSLGIYLTLQTGLTPSLDEIEFKAIDKQKLAKYAVKYPGTVRNTLMHSLAFEHFAA